MRRTAAVICPGRGTYTRTELGYLKRHPKRPEAQIAAIDAWLAAHGEPTVTALDAEERFSPARHTPGEFASTLIYACSMADLAAINPARFEIVAVAGNSMGWYTALAAAGAVEGDDATTLVHTMGSMMRHGVIGGQVIYPVVDAEWHPDPTRRASVEHAIAAARAVPGGEAYWSIRFGGFAVIGGNEAGLAALTKALPPVDDNRYPLTLVNHAAFHTPLLHDVTARAHDLLPSSLFRAPHVPLVDGRGAIWQPKGTAPEELRAYTLGTQVVETYDFSASIEVTLKEFAPDCLILLGPGSTSGGALGQILVEQKWYGLASKADFSKRQETDPVLLAMGREDQAKLVL